MVSFVSKFKTAKSGRFDGFARLIKICKLINFLTEKSKLLGNFQLITFNWWIKWMPPAGMGFTVYNQLSHGENQFKPLWIEVFAEFHIVLLRVVRRLQHIIGPFKWKVYREIFTLFVAYADEYATNERRNISLDDLQWPDMPSCCGDWSRNVTASFV